MMVDRKGDHRPMTRTKCPGRLHVLLDYKIFMWRVSIFDETHNHELTPVNHVHRMVRYHVMSNLDKAQVDSLHSFGVRIYCIMGYLLGQRGSYDSIGFLRSDLYNHLHQKKRLIIKEGDVCVALSYFEGKDVIDPMFYSKIETSTDEKLNHLFLADGCSRSNFQCFGDIFAFDATYKKNRCNKPLVIFLGCNHRSHINIFGCSLLTDETTGT